MQLGLPSYTGIPASVAQEKPERGSVQGAGSGTVAVMESATGEPRLLAAPETSITLRRAAQQAIWALESPQWRKRAQSSAVARKAVMPG